MPPSVRPVTPTPRASNPAGGPPPLRRRRSPAPAPAASRWREAVHYLLLFVIAVLLVDALIGDKGFMDTLRVRRDWQELARSIEALREENATLLERARHLREDPATLERVAREEYGLIRPGEILFILRDAGPASQQTH